VAWDWSTAQGWEGEDTHNGRLVSSRASRFAHSPPDHEQRLAGRKETNEHYFSKLSSYKPDNETGRRLYASLGFVETGEMMGEEAVALLQLK